MVSEGGGGGGGPVAVARKQEQQGSQLFQTHLNTQLLLLSSILFEDVSSKSGCGLCSQVSDYFQPHKVSRRMVVGLGFLDMVLLSVIWDRLRYENTADIDGHLCPLLTF